MSARRTNNVVVETITAATDIYHTMAAYYGDPCPRELEYARSRIQNLIQNAADFVNTGLKTIQLELEHDYGVEVSENWRVTVALPDPVITRQKQIAAARKAFDRYVASVCNETNTVQINAGADLRHSLDRLVNLFNSHLQFFAEQYNLPKARRVRLYAVKRLFNAIREIAAPLARGHTWTRPARTMKTYRPRTTITTNAHTPQTDEQVRCENFESINTSITVNLNPLSVEIDEDTVISRLRTNKIILHNLDTQCQP